MSHDILDDNKVALRGEPAWHGLGKVYAEDVTARQAYDDFGGGFELTMLPVGVMYDGEEFIKLPKNYAIVRGPTNNDSNKVVFGFATDHYHVVQPEEIIDGFDKKVGVSIETLGFISQGKKMFLTWKLPSCFVKETDEIQLYGTVLFGFDKVFSSRFNIGSVRVVCANTFQSALNEETQENRNKRGKGTIYSGKHSDKNLLPNLLAWMSHIQKNAEQQKNLVSNFFTKLSDTKIIHESQAKDLIYAAWPNPNPVSDFIPLELKKKAQEKIDMDVELKEKIRNGVYETYSTSEGIAIDETYYGLFNACTQYFNHRMEAKKETNFSIMWGNRNNHMNHFAEVLVNDIRNK